MLEFDCLYSFDLYLHQLHQGNKVDAGHGLAATLLLLLLLLALRG